MHSGGDARGEMTEAPTLLPLTDEGLCSKDQFIIHSTSIWSEMWSRLAKTVPAWGNNA